MNNTAITTLAIASVLMAATLVVGITLATITITPTTAFSDKTMEKEMVTQLQHRKINATR